MIGLFLFSVSDSFRLRLPIAFGLFHGFFGKSRVTGGGISVYDTRQPWGYLQHSNGPSYVDHVGVVYGGLIVGTIIKPKLGLVFSALDQAKKLRTRERQAKFGWTMWPPRGP